MIHHCHDVFLRFFDAFKLIGYDEGDQILARYLTELHSSNYFDDIEKHMENVEIPKSDDEINQYFQTELTQLKKTSEDVRYTSDEKRETARYLHRLLSNTMKQTNADKQLVQLHLEYTKLRQHLHDLHIGQDRNIDVIKDTLKSIMAPYFFIKIKLNCLLVETSSTTNYIPFMLRAILNKSGVLASYEGSLNMTDIFKIPKFSDTFSYIITRKRLIQIASTLLSSAGETISGSETEWQILIRIFGFRSLQGISKVKTSQERDELWTRIFKNEPLKNVSADDRWIWTGMMRLCFQLNIMREILIRKPPKVIISGRSQTGKSTLFKYLTGRNLKELRNINAFNTRMSLQCPAFIKFDNNEDQEDKSGIAIDVVDNSGQDDATGQAKNLLDMTLHSSESIYCGNNIG